MWQPTLGTEIIYYWTLCVTIMKKLSLCANLYENPRGHFVTSSNFEVERCIIYYLYFRC